MKATALIALGVVFGTALYYLFCTWFQNILQGGEISNAD